MDPHFFWSAGSGFRRAKMTHKNLKAVVDPDNEGKNDLQNRKKYRYINFIFCSAGCSLLKAIFIFSAIIFSSLFCGHQKLWIRNPIRKDKKCNKMVRNEVSLHFCYWGLHENLQIVCCRRYPHTWTRWWPPCCCWQWSSPSPQPESLSLSRY